PGGRRGSETSSRRVSRASSRCCAPPSAGGGVVSFAPFPVHGQRHPRHVPNTRFKMLTQGFLEFAGGGFGAQAPVLLERLHEAPAERVEYEAIGYRMHQPARDGAHAGERLQPVAGDRERDRYRAADAALAQGQELLDLEIPRRGAVELAERARHGGADVTLDHDVRARADRGQGADDGLAGRAADDLLRALCAVTLLRFVELLRR